MHVLSVRILSWHPYSLCSVWKGHNLKGVIFNAFIEWEILSRQFVQSERQILCVIF